MNSLHLVSFSYFDDDDNDDDGDDNNNMITATRITITMMRTTQMITMIKRVLVKEDVKVKIKSNGTV